MTRLMRRCGLACALALVVAGPASATAAAAKVRTGSWIAEQLRAGHRVVLKRATVTGPFDLDTIDTVRRLFECHGCTFRGEVSAHDVIFERTLDLSGSTFAKTVDFTGATFRAPALFRAAVSESEPSDAEAKCRFRKDAVFSLAVFGDLVSFGRSTFCGAADFRDTRFSDATFSGARFQIAEFDRASFRGVALFNDAHFAAHASFEEADFRLRADFARARFKDGGDYAGTRLAEGASFLVARFSVIPSKQERDIDAATFQDAVSSGDLNFTFASFNNEIATFSGLVSSGSLVLRDAEFDPVGGVNMDRLQVRDLILDIDAVKGISEDEQRRAVLGMIESSAKERGDLQTANDAHYELRKLRSHDYSPVWAAADYVFYRGVAGYFVRPLRPLIVLAAIAIMVALLRTRARGTAPDEPTTRSPARTRTWRVPVTRRPRDPFWRGARRRCGTFFTCLLDTFAVAGPRWRGRDRTLSLSERFEVVAYRLLLVCALIGLANSNPTLREMVDSLL